ncbi:hypothetical protein ACJJTC_004705 [Scirpophaga incertulas]
MTGRIACIDYDRQESTPLGAVGVANNPGVFDRLFSGAADFQRIHHSCPLQGRDVKMIVLQKEATATQDLSLDTIIFTFPIATGQPQLSARIFTPKWRPTTSIQTFLSTKFLANSTANNDTESNYQSSDTTGSGVDNTDNADLMPPPKEHIENTRKKQKMNAVDKQIIDILQKSLNAKEQNETGRLTKEDDDKLFCLSLYSELKKVPENQRLTTKIELLSVIKEAQKYHQSLPLQTNQHQYMYSTPTYSGYTTARPPPPPQQWSTTPPPPPSSWSPSPTGSSQDSDSLDLFE